MRSLRTISIVMITTMMAATAFGSTKEPDFFADLLQPRVDLCKSKFDITPYLIESIGGQQKMPIKLKFIESLQHFRATGHVIMTPEQAADPVARSCAEFAEGMLAEGVTRKVLDVEADSCRPHLDITSYREVADGVESNNPIDPAFFASMKRWSATGHILLSRSQSADLAARTCANYAEGIMAAGITKQIIVVMTKAAGKMMAEAVKSLGKALDNALAHGARPKLDASAGN